MRRKKSFAGVVVVLAVVAVSLMMRGDAAAQTESGLFSFGGQDGFSPLSGLVFDSAGNLYGTTQLGGSGFYGYGTAFELSPAAGGGWTQTVLHNFGSGTDGWYPESALVMDSAGNLYGTTAGGGTGHSGIAFELTPMKGGGWKETVLYDFGTSTSGESPATGVVRDAAGNLYGTTVAGGTGGCTNNGNVVIGCGTVFELSPQTGGGWAEKILYSFTAPPGSFDGTAVPSRLVLDSAGNLYGTTEFFGKHNGGMAFELSPSGGVWHVKILYNFSDAQPAVGSPLGGLSFDSKGNLYGTAAGGSHASGAVFELVPRSGEGSALKVLHNFDNNGKDGFDPISGVVIDSDGNLYGATPGGGTGCTDLIPPGCGTVFELSPTEGGAWRERILHNFDGGPSDGSDPWGRLVFDSSGNLFGTTEYGGANNFGIVFEVTP